MNIALVEYGAGNLPSVERALTRLGVESRRASTLEGLASCDALILPGVGHFGALMRSLTERSLVKPLRDAVASGVPLLGICLGLQAMFAKSDEAIGDAGLGLFPQNVSALPPTGRSLQTASVCPPSGTTRREARFNSRTRSPQWPGLEPEVKATEKPLRARPMTGPGLVTERSATAAGAAPAATRNAAAASPLRTKIYLNS